MIYSAFMITLGVIAVHYPKIFFKLVLATFMFFISIGKENTYTITTALVEFFQNAP